jgi:hypothetical protein
VAMADYGEAASSDFCISHAGVRTAMRDIVAFLQRTRTE